MIIADTSLIVHLFNETQFTKIAQEIRHKDSHWIVPHLWREEYANVLSKQARKEHQPIHDVMKNFDYTTSKLKNFEINVDVKKALRIAIEYKISVYNAHFVTLAIDFNTLLITEDNEVLKKCPGVSIGMAAFLKLSKR